MGYHGLHEDLPGGCCGLYVVRTVSVKVWGLPGPEAHEHADRL